MRVRTVLVGLARAAPLCGAGVPASEVRLADYSPYNLNLTDTRLNLTLGFEETLVHSELVVRDYRGGEVVLNGSPSLELDGIHILYNYTANGTRYTYKRDLSNKVCSRQITSGTAIVGEDLVIPETALSLRGNRLDRFHINVTTRIHPARNLELFGIYKSRQLLVSQNESSGFRRITYYPDRPDVLSRFTTTLRGAVADFPVMLANGNRVYERDYVSYAGASSAASGGSQQGVEQGTEFGSGDDEETTPATTADDDTDDGGAVAMREVQWLDPYPKPAYLFAIAAGDLAYVEQDILVGRTCQEARAALEALLDQPLPKLADVCRSPVKLEDTEDEIVHASALRRRLTDMGISYLTNLFTKAESAAPPEPNDEAAVDLQAGDDELKFGDAEEVVSSARGLIDRARDAVRSGEAFAEFSLRNITRNFKATVLGREWPAPTAPPSYGACENTELQTFEAAGTGAPSTVPTGPPFPGVSNSLPAAVAPATRVSSTPTPADLADLDDLPDLGDLPVDSIPADAVPTDIGFPMDTPMDSPMDDAPMDTPIDMPVETRSLPTESPSTLPAVPGVRGIRFTTTTEMATSSTETSVPSSETDDPARFDTTGVADDADDVWRTSTIVMPSTTTTTITPVDASTSDASAHRTRPWREVLGSLEHSSQPLCEGPSVPPGCLRTIKARVWAERGETDLQQLDWALESVVLSFLWDEVRFGRYYDLDEFNVVSVRDFNAGAMENKGLNIFNEALILAEPSITTDAQYERIRAVIAHEYFHNWSGDRVTVRDWFQLTLKEGLTVYRDQMFTDDTGGLVKRLRDAMVMETVQFPQDAGALSHPIRPSVYKTVENFYTVTVYEKGAEVVRMLQTLLGWKTFRAGLQRYFDTQDGHAATCEDFVGAMSQASGKNLNYFFRWYNTSGTPVVKVDDVKLSPRNRLSVTLSQTTTPPLTIPIRLAFLANATVAERHTVVLEKKRQIFNFYGISERPVISLLRGFSAPVRIEPFQSDADLVYLAMYETDDYARYKAISTLLDNEITGLVHQMLGSHTAEARDDEASTRQQEVVAIRYTLPTKIKRVFARVFDEIAKSKCEDRERQALLSELVKLPLLSRTKTLTTPYRPLQATAAVQSVRRSLVKRFGSFAAQEYMRLERLEDEHPYSLNMASRRALKNAILRLLLVDDRYIPLGVKQLQRRRQANDELAALSALAATTNDPDVQVILTEWLQRNSANELLGDRWLTAQMGWVSRHCADRYQQLLQHPLYANSTSPNRLRALSRAFTANSVAFHQPKGYQLVVDEVLRWDAFNPKLAAGLASSFGEVALVDASLRRAAASELERALRTPTLSVNTREVLTRALQAAN